MKYTVENTSAVGRHKRVFVDGVELRNVIECDTSEGYATYHPTDENGNLRICGDDLATETIHGVVTVEDVA